MLGLCGPKEVKSVERTALCMGPERSLKNVILGCMGPKGTEFSV